MAAIRLGTINDLEGVLTVNKVIDYNNPPWFMEESIHDERLFVSEVHPQNIIGYGMYQVIWGNTPAVSLLKVLPEHQGKGVGSELLETIENAVQNKGFKFILSSTESANTLSQQFHDKHGFKPIGNLQMPHGQEKYFMKALG